MTMSPTTRSVAPSTILASTGRFHLWGSLFGQAIGGVNAEPPESVQRRPDFVARRHDEIDSALGPATKPYWLSHCEPSGIDQVGTLRHMPSVEDNRKVWGGTYDWPNSGDEWSAPWGGTEAQWHAVILPRLEPFLPASYGARDCSRLRALEQLSDPAVRSLHRCRPGRQRSRHLPRAIRRCRSCRVLCERRSFTRCGSRIHLSTSPSLLTRWCTSKRT